ncbi:MAG TPA: hypothetical protein VJT13_21730 [Xanthobacteraceae bacterium]|nr:hypothetical protein [Xanthobacteraceae bacterium]
MRQYIVENWNQIIDGLLFGLGVLAVYLGAVATGAIIRSLGGAGSKGLTVLGRYATGWFDYVRGDDRNMINVTLNMVIDGHLKFDTIVSDRRIWHVWPNQYRVYLIRRAAKLTTEDNPVIVFPPKPRQERRSLAERITDRFASVKITENGRSRRVPLMREDDYRATYAPLISLISEKCTNDDSIDLALGRPMEEHRFVIALTFEQLSNRRARHLRAMVIWEQGLLHLPDEMPRVDFEEHKTRYRTLQAIARQYRAHPDRFGIVKVWRPRLPQVRIPETMAGALR